MIESFQAWASSPEAQERLPYLLLDAVFFVFISICIFITTRHR